MSGLNGAAVLDADPVSGGEFPRGVVGECPGVRGLAREVALARAVVELQDDPALTDARSARERRADRRVVERVRAAERAERRRAGLAEIAAARRERREARWSGRAAVSKDRLLDPSRRLTATYRRYVGLSMVPPLLIAFGVLFMSIVVHDGVVGVGGPWYGYLIEPMASVLLVVSLLVGFTAVQNGRAVPRGLWVLDAGLAAASMALTVVPWGLRYGFDPGTTLAHALPPLLVVAAVVVAHVLHAVFGPIFTDLYADLCDDLTPTRLDESAADTVVLYERTRRAVADGHLTTTTTGAGVSVSREAIRRSFGVAKNRAQLAGDAYEHVTALLHPTGQNPAKPAQTTAGPAGATAPSGRAAPPVQARASGKRPRTGTPLPEHLPEHLPGSWDEVLSGPPLTRTAPAAA